MVLPNFKNLLMSLIRFWRATLALVLECYDEFLNASKSNLSFVCKCNSSLRNVDDTIGRLLEVLWLQL
jgi:hypothetical protein